VSGVSGPLGGTRVRFGPEIFRIQPRGGVSRYVVELHRGLLAAGVDSAVVAGWHTSEVLGGVPGVRGLRAPRIGDRAPGRVATRLVDEVVAARGAGSLTPDDIWHPTYFPRRVPRGRSRGGPALVVTVYDMIHERFPEWVQPRDRSAVRKAAACAAADLVCCISQDTADDLQERLGVDPGKVAVTRLGVTPVVPVSRTPPFGAAPYVVYVGDRRSPHKNWHVLLDALVGADADLHLVCIGSPAGPTDRTAVAERGLESRVRFEGGADADVAGRLADAAGLVYPSRYEGFGLPPLEALAQGCPVVAADAGAIVEVVGGMAILVPPTVDGIGSGLAQLLAGGPEVEHQRTDGPAFAARFTWEATAAATIEAYRTLVI
jgi:glycosyltransferase involved in cell wall biosynthesis